MDKWIAIFKSGKHEDSIGNAHSYSNDDLDAIVEKYNEQDDDARHEAPVVIGHPKDNAPAWGWVDSLKRQGNILYANFKDIVDEFSEMLEKKMFKKRSISLYKNGTLRHVGFLGAAPPAIKGLPDFAFTDDDDNLEFEFAEVDWKVRSIGTMFRRLRDWMIDEWDKETADDILPDWDVNRVENHEPEPVANDAPAEAYNEHKEAEMPTVEELQAKLDAAEQKNTEFAEKLQTAEKERDDMKAKTDKEESDRRHAQHEEFAETLSKDEKLAPKHQSMAVAIMDALDTADPIEYAEGDDSKSVDAVEGFQNLLSEILNPEDFSEVATKDKTKKNDQQYDSPGDELEAKIKEIQERDTCDYREAMNKAQLEFPELAEEYAENPA